MKIEDFHDKSTNHACFQRQWFKGLRDSKLKKDDEIGDAGAEHGSEIRSGEREESMTRQRRQVSEIIKNNFKISLVSHR